MNTRSLLLASLTAGALIGLFGNLPLFNLVNCVLCAWVWIGGALSVPLYRRFQGGKPALTTGQGAGLGALSGFFGALVGAVVFLVTSPLSTPLFNALARALDIEGVSFQNGFWENASAAFIFLVLDAILYPIFGALGGVIAANLARKSPPELETAF